MCAYERRRERKGKKERKREEGRKKRGKEIKVAESRGQLQNKGEVLKKMDLG
jgi:hypothetical protein